MNVAALELALANNIGNTLTPELAVGLLHAAQQTQDRRIDVHGFAPLEYVDYVISCEYLETALEQVKPLHRKHWEETEKYRHNIPLNPDYEYMVNAERQGRFMLFTVRSANNLVGNCMMYLSRSTHTQELVAEEDTIFIDPAHRIGRVGIKFIKYVEDVMQQLGVKEIRVTVKTVNRVGDLLQALGYSHTANQLVKVLGEAHVQ